MNSDNQSSRARYQKLLKTYQDAQTAKNQLQKQNQRLQETQELLLTQLKANVAQVDDLVGRRNKLQENVTELRNLLGDHPSLLRHEKRALEQSLKLLVVRSHILERRNQSLLSETAALEKMRQEVESLKPLEKLREELANLETERAKLPEQTVSAEVLEAARENLRQMECQLALAHQRLEPISWQMMQHRRAQLDFHQKQLLQLQDTLAINERERSKLSLLMEQQGAQLDIQQSQLDLLQRQQDGQQQAIDQVHQELLEESALLQAAQTQLSQLLQEQAQLLEELPLPGSLNPSSNSNEIDPRGAELQDLEQQLQEAMLQEEELQMRLQVVADQLAMERRLLSSMEARPQDSTLIEGSAFD